jgi:hypothetical protein
VGGTLVLQRWPRCDVHPNCGRSSERALSNRLERDGCWPAYVLFAPQPYPAKHGRAATWACCRILSPLVVALEFLIPLLRNEVLVLVSTAGCGDIDPCTPCMCERVSTPSDEGYARIILRGSTTLKTALDAGRGRAGSTTLWPLMADLTYRELRPSLGCAARRTGATLERLKACSQGRWRRVGAVGVL